LPAVGVAVTDPEFHTTIRRLSNAGTGNVIKTAYSTIPAWNADESYIILYHTGSTVPGGGGHHLYNGKTYQYIRKLDIDPPDIEQFFWDTHNADWLYYVDSANQLIRYRASTAAKDVLHKFSCTGQVSSGGDVMFTSWDSDLFGSLCGNKKFSYRLSTNTESARVRVSASSGLSALAVPSGTAMYVGKAPQAQRYDTNMNFLNSLPLSGLNHSSLGMLSDGTDVLSIVGYDGAYQGTLIVADVAGTASPKVIIGPSTGYPYPPGTTHITTSAFKMPGWTGVSVVGDPSGQTLLNQELLLVNTNSGGSICRIAHHHSYGDSGTMGYWAEPHPSISPSGTRILFGSDWGNSGSVDAYVVELPSYQ
jgi:hypothetical protein